MFDGALLICSLAARSVFFVQCDLALSVDPRIKHFLQEQNLLVSATTVAVGASIFGADVVSVVIVVAIFRGLSYHLPYAYVWYIYFSSLHAPFVPSSQMCLGSFACVIPVAYMKPISNTGTNAKRYKMRTWRLTEHPNRSYFAGCRWRWLWRMVVVYLCVRVLILYHWIRVRVCVHGYESVGTVE